jgi:hypothetical protein
MLTLFVSLIAILIIFPLLFKYTSKYKSGFLLFHIKCISIFNTSAYVHALEDLLGLPLSNSLGLNAVSSTLLQTVVVLGPCASSHNTHRTPFDGIDVVDSQSPDPVTPGSASLATAAAPPTLAAESEASDRYQGARAPVAATAS